MSAKVGVGGWLKLAALVVAFFVVWAWAEGAFWDWIESNRAANASSTSGPPAVQMLDPVDEPQIPDEPPPPAVVEPAPGWTCTYKRDCPRIG